MAYYFECYYSKQDKIPLREIIFESASIVSGWANTYDIGYPGSYHQNHGNERIKSGELLGTNREKECLFEPALNEFINSYSKKKLFENLLMVRLFAGKKWPDGSPRPIFEYDNDTSDWIIDINEKQFAELQNELEKRGLPKDLFFSNDDWIVVPEDITPEERAKGVISSSRSFSPKQWEQMKKDNRPITKQKHWRYADYENLNKCY